MKPSKALAVLLYSLSGMGVYDPSEVIDPAVNGGTGILTSNANFGTKVKRVVFVSSLVTVNITAEKWGILSRWYVV
jgi:hypothetical protein